MTPFEIIAGPLEVWLAPVGTAFPVLTAAPAGPWAKLGVNGTNSMEDGGVTVSHVQKLETPRPAGSTMPVKAFRTEEEFMIGFDLWDLTMETYATALNKATVTTTAAGVGTAGTKKIGIGMGPDVASYALIARGTLSAYGDGWAAQYQIPRVFQSANPKPLFKLGKPAGLAFEFTALADLTVPVTERFGSIIHQHAAALP